MKWKQIKSDKDLPSDVHFRNHTEYWACKNGVVFKIYFYNSYGGKNYSLAEHNDDKIRKIMAANNVMPMAFVGELDAYMSIKRPEPFKKI